MTPLLLLFTLHGQALAWDDIIGPTFAGEVFSYDLAGVETLVGTPWASSPHVHGKSIIGLAYNADADVYYAVAPWDDEVKTVDATTGASDLLLTGDYSWAHYQHDTGLLLLSQSTSIDAVDLETGEITTLYHADPAWWASKPFTMHGTPDELFLLEHDIETSTEWRVKSVDVPTGEETILYTSVGTQIMDFKPRRDAPGWIMTMRSGDVLHFDPDFGDETLVTTWADSGLEPTYESVYRYVTPSPDEDGYVFSSDWADLVHLDESWTAHRFFDGVHVPDGGVGDRLFGNVRPRLPLDEDGDGVVHWYYGGGDLCPLEDASGADVDADGCIDEGPGGSPTYNPDGSLGLAVAGVPGGARLFFNTSPWVDEDGWNCVAFVNCAHVLNGTFYGACRGDRGCIYADDDGSWSRTFTPKPSDNYIEAFWQDPGTGAWSSAGWWPVR